MVAAGEAPGLAGLDSGSRTHDARESRFGRLYEDLVPGDRFRHWPGKTITEGDHHVFCLLTMSASPLHTDAEYARANMPGGVNIVLGSYVYALVLGMSVPDLSGRAVANLGLEKLSHLAPVHHGDTLYAWSKIVERRPIAQSSGPRDRHRRHLGGQPGRCPCHRVSPQLHGPVPPGARLSDAAFPGADLGCTSTRDAAGRALGTARARTGAWPGAEERGHHPRHLARAREAC